MTDGSESRALAADLVYRVLTGGAYSNVLVPNETGPLPRQDARFVHRLVYTVLRFLPRLDHTIAAYADRPKDRIDPITLDGLRVGAAELLVLGSSPYGAVDAAVDAVRLRGAPRAAGFVNAVLRKMAAGGEVALPAGIAGTAMHFGAAPWLYEHLRATWGTEETEAFLASSNEPARLSIRVREGSSVGHGERVPGVSEAFWCDEPEVVRSLVAEGTASIADPASTAVGHAVGVRPGMRVADLASAPGGKTLQLVDAMAGGGTLLAIDRHERRIQSARRRLGTDGATVTWVVADARQPPLAPRRFDRVLLDAPCTGLGTLRRRPEIKHRLAANAPFEAGKRQRAMLDAALALLAPGGRLVYSVCTVFAEETVDVVAGRSGRAPTDLPGRPFGDGLLLGPHTTGTDGMFICVFDR